MKDQRTQGKDCEPDPDKTATEFEADARCRLQEAVDRSGQSYRDLDHGCGFTVGTIGKTMRSRRKLDLCFLFKLCQQLKTELASIFKGGANLAPPELEVVPKQHHPENHESVNCVSEQNQPEPEWIQSTRSATDTRRIDSDALYETEELANVLRKKKDTILMWHKCGLMTLRPPTVEGNEEGKNRVPHLFHGADVISFMKQMATSTGQNNQYNPELHKKLLAAAKEKRQKAQSRARKNR